MAHLWRRNAAGDLEEQRLEDGGAALDRSLQIRAAVAAPGAPWVLIAGIGAAVRVNGSPVSAGIRVLDHRDEIRCHDGRIVVFADDEPAQVVAYPAAPRPARCARCTCDLEPSTPAVRCPVCGSWYHEREASPCWSSIPFCQACGCGTASSAGRWMPEEF